MINDDEFSQHLDQAHLELASKGADLGALLNVAGPLEKREKKKHPAARALVTKAWAAHVAPRDFAVQMERALDRDLDLTDPDAAWSVLTDKLETSAKALADELVLYGYRKVKKPGRRSARALARGQPQGAPRYSPRGVPQEDGEGAEAEAAALQGDRPHEAAFAHR